MIKIVVCDDDSFDIDITKKLVSKYIKCKKDKDIIVKYFNSPYDLVSDIREGKYYDIYLLDVIMTGIDSIDIGKEIRQNQEYATIIYLTESEEYALDSYKVNALQYLLKPIDKDCLYLALDNAMNQLDNKDKKIVIKTKTGINVLLLHQIVFAEYSEHAVNYCTVLGDSIKSVVTREPFAETIKVFLNDDSFLRCHKSFVINMKYIAKIGKKDFTTYEGVIIPISASLYSKAKNAYFDYLVRNK